MKTLLAVSLIAALAAGGAQAHPSKAKIAITATVEDASVKSDRFSRFFLLWNKEITSRPIGNAYVVCAALHFNHAFECRGYFNLALGKLVTYGIAHNLRRMWLSAFGASGFYLGFIGNVRFLEAAGPGEFMVVFQLNHI